MRVQNTGDSPFEFTAALHSYLEVTDIGEARVRGLKGLQYLDKVRAVPPPTLQPGVKQPGSSRPGWCQRWLPVLPG